MTDQPQPGHLIDASARRYARKENPMTDRPTEKPDSPGIWTREGEPYLLYRSLAGELAGEVGLIKYAALTPHEYIEFGHRDDLPTGNWRKLAEIFAGVADQITDLKSTIARLEGEVERWRESLDEYMQAVDEVAKLLGIARPADLPIPVLPNFLEALKEKFGQPEVIVGNGQATESEVACYMDEWPDGCIQLVRFGPDSIFKEGHRYMRCPTFPPRKPAFVAPPKPEQKLVRASDGQKGEPFYVVSIATQPGFYRAVMTGTIWHPKNIELLDETTGEVLQ